MKIHPITDLVKVEQPSSKVLVLTLSSTATPLQFHTGSSSVSAAIVKKLEQSKTAAGEVLQILQDEAAQAGYSSEEETTPPVHEPKTVRWAEPTPESPVVDTHATTEACVVLYDFEAGDEDELSVNEGETLTILEKENAEWWRVRNAHGQEGVVPAQYVEVSEGGANGAAHDDGAAERRRHEEEAAAAATAAAAAEAARREEAARKAEERRAIEQAARERAAQEEADRELAEQVEAEERAKQERRRQKDEADSRQQREYEAAKR